MRVSDGRGGSGEATCPVRLAAPERRPETITCDSAGFPPNLARLNNVDKACLDDVASRLRQDPRSRVIVIGHADTAERRPDVVARQRAEAAKTYLVSERGIEESRVSVRSAEASQPREARSLTPEPARGARLRARAAPCLRERIRRRCRGRARPARPSSIIRGKTCDAPPESAVILDRVVGSPPAGPDRRRPAVDPGRTAGRRRALRWRSIRSTPRRIYLGTAEGVLYRSEASGLVWQRLQPGFPARGQSLDEIVVSPAGALLVGFWDVHGQGGGVAVSTDRGQTFTIAAGLEGESVRALALAPSDPRQAVAGTLSGVFASRDGGLSWRRISPEGHPELRNVQSVAIDPRDPRVIYVGTWHLPWKTSDGGAHLEAASTAA